MARVEWDKTGEKRYETGADRGVLYKKTKEGTYTNGVAWNGLTGVSESPSGAEAEALYANNAKYLDLISAEEFGFSITAYTYPDFWEECDGSKELAPGVYITQQNRSHFGFSYRTLIGNDVENTDFGYKLHLVYDCTAAPSDKENSTINESVEAAELSWECSTTPVKVAGMKPTAHIVIDSTKCDKTELAKLEDILYGTDTDEPRLPLPAELVTIFAATGSTD